MNLFKTSSFSCIIQNMGYFWVAYTNFLYRIKNSTCNIIQNIVIGILTNCHNGVVHKWRHTVPDNFFPPPPSSRVLFLSSQNPRPAPYLLRPWRHLWTTPNWKEEKPNLRIRIYNFQRHKVVERAKQLGIYRILFLSILFPVWSS